MGDNDGQSEQPQTDNRGKLVSRWTAYRVGVVGLWICFTVYIGYLEAFEVTLSTHPQYYIALVAVGGLTLLTTTFVMHRGLSRVEEHISEGKEEVEE